MKKLRAWQAAAYPVVMRAWQARTHGLVRAATGGGKSILLALVARSIPLSSRSERIVITAPTQQIVRQLQSTFHELQTRHSAFYAEEKDIYHPIIVTCNNSVETLYHTLARKKLDVTAWIADECHGTESPTMQAWAESWPNAWRLGFTATPHRATDKERLTLYDHLLYEYTAEQALADGVIVPPSILPYRREKKQLDEACIEAILGEPMLRGLPGLISAWSIPDATQFAQKLSRAGCRAAPIHGEQPPDLQKRLLEALRRGSLGALVHVNLLTEGADLPFLRWLCMRRATKDRNTSRNRFIQEVGRGLRSYPGKSEFFIIDPHDLFNRLQLTYAAVLGQEIEEETEEAEETEEKRVSLGGGGYQGERLSEGERIASLEMTGALRERQILRAMAVKLRLQGKIPPSQGRRAAPPTQEQLRALGIALRAAKQAEGRVAPSLKGLLSALAREGVRSELTAGDLEDLLGVLAALRGGSIR